MPLQTFLLSLEAEFQFLKVEVADFWGHGGGLQFFDIVRNSIDRGELGATMLAVTNSHCSGAQLMPLEAFMSSQHSSHKYNASNCIDGQHGGDSTMCHTSDTSGERAPWLALQFSTEVQVSSVTLFNRENCCGERTRNIKVRVADELPNNGDMMFTRGQLLGFFEGPGSNGQRIAIPRVPSTSTLIGRYLIIQIDHTENVLNLDEVVVFGHMTPVITKELLDTTSTILSGPKRCPTARKPAICPQDRPCLDGGTSATEGNVYYNKSPVCDDNWTMELASYVCQQLGYGLAMGYKKASYFGLVEGPFMKLQLTGVGKHNHTVSSSETCLGDEAAGVVYETVDQKMAREEKERHLDECFVRDVAYIDLFDPVMALTEEICQSLCEIDSVCLHFTFNTSAKICSKSSSHVKRVQSGLVSGPRNCEQVATAIKVEDPQCMKAGALCLGSTGRAPGINASSGNIFVGGRPVCDDSWNLVDAEVLCTQLGFHGVEYITSQSHFGYVSGHFSMDQVECLGSENQLVDCLHATEDHCYGGEAAGVACDTRDEEAIEREKKITKNCFVEDVDYGGVLLETVFNLNSVGKCHSYCNKNTRCDHFSWRPGKYVYYKLSSRYIFRLVGNCP